MKKIGKTKFFVTAIFAFAIMLASCDNAVGGGTVGNGQGDGTKSVLDTPQNALKNIPLVSELINQALGKTPSSPSLRAASAFDDMKDGLEDYMLHGNDVTNAEIFAVFLKFDFSKMNLRFGDVYRIPSDFDFSQETRNYLHNMGEGFEDPDYFRDIRDMFRNGVFQIVKDSPTTVYCYFKLNGGNFFVKLSENITSILDMEALIINEDNFSLSWYERVVESNGKKIRDIYNYPVINGRASCKSIIDSINQCHTSFMTYFNPDTFDSYGFENKYVSGFSRSSFKFYATSGGKRLAERWLWEENWKNRYYLKYLTPIKAGLQLDGDVWKWGDGTPATEIQFTTQNGKKIYYVYGEEVDLPGNFSVPASTKNIITTLDAKFAEMETEANEPGFFLTEIPNEADWKKRLDDWLAICETAE